MKARTKLFIAIVGSYIAVIIYSILGTLLAKTSIAYIPRLLIAETALVIMSVGIAVWLKRQSIFKLTTKSMKTGFLCGITLIILALFNLFGVFFQKSDDVFTGDNLILNLVLLIIQALFVGIAEETLFRGIILNELRDFFGRDKLKTVYLSVYISAVLFGCTHFSNLFKGASFSGTLMQVVSTIGIGAILGAVYYRSNNLWVVVILHGMQDLVGFIKGGMLSGGSAVDIISDYGANALIAPMVLLLISVFLLRKKKVLPLLNSEQ